LTLSEALHPLRGQGPFGAPFWRPCLPIFRPPYFGRPPFW